MFSRLLFCAFCAFSRLFRFPSYLRSSAVRFSSSFFWGFWYIHHHERLFVRVGDRDHYRASGGVSLYLVGVCAGFDKVVAAAV
jgi:hypothetical protein